MLEETIVSIAFCWGVLWVGGSIMAMLFLVALIAGLIR